MLDKSVSLLYNNFHVCQGRFRIMAKCSYCDKKLEFGIQVSHSHRRSNRTWKPNVKRVKAIVDGSPKHVYACTRCLRSGKVTRAA
jgi:large subunit ribosomal protein L28